MANQASVQSDSTTVKSGKAANIALWAVQILGAAMFLMAGGNKLAGNEQMVGLFDVIGFGQWFRYATGAIEVGSAVALLTPRYSGIGALLLVGTMIGAILTHVLVLGDGFAMPAVLLGLMVIVGVARKKQTLSLLKLG